MNTGEAAPRNRVTVVVLRWALVVLGAVQTGIGLDDLERPTHALGELATWQVASAVALLSMARRPATAEGISERSVIATLARGVPIVVVRKASVEFATRSVTTCTPEYPSRPKRSKNDRSMASSG